MRRTSAQGRWNSCSSRSCRCARTAASCVACLAAQRCSSKRSRRRLSMPPALWPRRCQAWWTCSSTEAAGPLRTKSARKNKNWCKCCSRCRMHPTLVNECRLEPRVRVSTTATTVGLLQGSAAACVLSQASPTLWLRDSLVTGQRLPRGPCTLSVINCEHRGRIVSPSGGAVGCQWPASALPRASSQRRLNIVPLRPRSR
mmetsp:Transcript_32427/g.74235  ORF Transcript_32427/g.74235 Transcript_32427/m.74235 type:complete len:200 (-) Transcript_32427:23-622(-)